MFSFILGNELMNLYKKETTSSVVLELCIPLISDSSIDRSGTFGLFVGQARKTFLVAFRLDLMMMKVQILLRVLKNTRLK